MEPPPKRQRVSRLKARNFYYRDYIRKRGAKEHEDNYPSIALSKEDEPYGMQKQRSEPQGRDTSMKPRHPDVEVVVDVVSVDINVEVDNEGNTIGVYMPTVPAVPQFPSDFTVPSVPPFPSVAYPSLPQVPPYPFTTAVNSDGSNSPSPTGNDNTTQSNDVTGMGYTSRLSTTTSSIDTTTTSTTPTPSTTASTLIGSNTDTESVTTSSNPTTGSYFSSTITTTSIHQSASPDSSSFHPTTVVPGIAGPPGSAITSASGNGGGNGNNNVTSTPALVGGVVGGIAGFVLLLAAALIVLRYVKQKRRGGAVQLDEGDGGDNGPLTMSERQSFMPPAAAAFFNRFSGASRDTDVSTERSFQRVSGRKLPSAFSPGMSMEEARDLQTLSQSSFYRDSQGFHGGSAAAVGTGAGATVVGLSNESEKETMMPGPARTPVVHQPQLPPYGFAPVGGTGSHTSGTSTLSPPSPHPLSRGGTLGRSHPSFDGSRGSKFTEDV